MKIRFSLFALSMIILPSTPNLLAADLVYVSMTNNTIVVYDTSSGVDATIRSTAKTFVSSNLGWQGISGIAIDSTGNLYASNGIGHTINIFDSSGAYLSSISTNQINPCGLAFDSFGNIYAADGDGYTISKFDSSGAYLNSISTGTYGPGGLVIDSSDNLYVAFIYNDFIKKFDSSGVFKSTIGGSPNLSGPVSLARDSAGTMYVANYNSNTIRKFDSSGVFQSTIGGFPNLNTPQSIAADFAGNIYAVNSNGYKSISKFDSSGNFLFSWVPDYTFAVAPLGIAIRPTTVPEPSTYTLAGIALVIAAVTWQHRKQQGHSTFHQNLTP